MFAGVTLEVGRGAKGWCGGGRLEEKFCMIHWKWRDKSRGGYSRWFASKLRVSLGDGIGGKKGE